MYVLNVNCASYTGVADLINVFVKNKGSYLIALLHLYFL